MFMVMKFNLNLCYTLAFSARLGFDGLGSLNAYLTFYSHLSNLIWRTGDHLVAITFPVSLCDLKLYLRIFFF